MKKIILFGFLFSAFFNFYGSSAKEKCRVFCKNFFKKFTVTVFAVAVISYILKKKNVSFENFNSKLEETLSKAKNKLKAGNKNNLNNQALNELPNQNQNKNENSVLLREEASDKKDDFGFFSSIDLFF